MKSIIKSRPKSTTKSTKEGIIPKTISKTIGKNMNEKKYMFTLKGVNTEKVDQRFSISIVSNINCVNEHSPKNTTKISDLSTSRNTPEIISFIDEAKKTHKCTISMVDFTTKKEFSYSTVYDCFWCRNSIPQSVSPIGCPVRYTPSQAVKTYYSEISKDKYTIKENITIKRQKLLEESKNLSVIKNNFYLTDGIFCSFNCCMAYIEDNKNNSMYDISEMLLLKMYHDIYPTKVQSIDKAPHWRKLKQCGGDLNIEKFRDSFNKIEYQDHGYINSLPKFKSMGVLFEEKLKF
jgi:hypothetical protein